MTWCVDKINNNDIEYVRKDTVSETINALIKCYDFIQELKNYDITDWSEEDNVKKVLTNIGGL